MTARAQLLRHLTELSDEDVQALLGVAERLRAKHLPPQASATSAPSAAVPPEATHHPERFGALVGSVRFADDVESPVIDAAAWTADEGNLAP
jgi:hypothetical protein